MEILTVRDLSFRYPECSAAAIENISFSLEKGEFAVLCGGTGSGKSTLLRMIKRELTPLGDKTGTVRFMGRDTGGLDDRTAASAIGFVMQKPEQQIVTDKVWHELAFGLENLGISQEETARRTAEMASYFGIGEWFSRDVSELSGGQKQLLNLASVLVMQPELLILDEPTAQLDPIAASDFIATLKRLNQDFSLTILMVEHRLEDVVPVCDRLMVLEGGHLTHSGRPEEVVTSIRSRDEIMCGMPAAARIYCELESAGASPLTVRGGRRYIEESYKNEVRSLHEAAYSHSPEPALEMKEVYFRYTRESDDVLSGLDLTVYSGEIFCLLGGNGSGKTTTLKAASELVRIYSGRIKVFGRKLKEYKNRTLYNECLAMLPQDVQTVFLKNTVREELQDAGADIDALPYDISHLLDKHPYDLSGGEQQLAALAKVLAARPRLLLLDEPTKGLDAYSRGLMTEVLRRLKAGGVTVVIVTHDVEFAAECADRCGLFFGGRVVSCGTPTEFFSGNSFYTTAVSRMTRGYYDGAVTAEQVAELCRRNGRRKTE